ncbi:hypothetical protein MTR67_018720, partial [Solanum verrucosum]
YWNTDKFKAMSKQVKKDRGSLKGSSLHTGGVKSIGTNTRDMEKEIGPTPIEPEVFKMTHVKKKENESDPDVKSGRATHKGRVYGRGSRNHVRRLQSGLQRIGSSRQAEALDAIQIAAMLAQIAQLTSALAESEWRRVVEQECMSTTIQQIKEQVMNLAH